MSVLVIAEHDHGSLKGAALNTVSAALQCSGDIHLMAGDLFDVVPAMVAELGR